MRNEEERMGRDLSKEFPSPVDRFFRQYADELSRVKLVEEIMSKEPLTIGEKASVAEAAKIMGEKHIGSLIVLREGKPWAIITERDVLSRVLALGKDPKNVEVREAMSTPLIAVEPKATTKEAARLMIDRKGRLVVFKGKDLVGIVTASDLIKSLPASPETSLKVDDFMTRSVISVDEDLTISEVARIMGKKRIGSVLVNRDGKHCGIFTERDLLTSFLARGGNLSTLVGVAASSPLITMPSGTTIHKAAYTMAKKHIKRLPVVKKKEIIGIITARDLVEVYAR